MSTSLIPKWFDFEKFYVQMYPNNKSQKQSTKKLFDLVSAQVFAKDTDCVTVETIIKAISANSVKLSETKFKATKTLLKRFCEYTQKQTSNDVTWLVHIVDKMRISTVYDDNDSNEARFLFKDANEMDSKLEATGIQIGESLIHLRVAALLLWHGLMLDEIVNIRHEHIGENYVLVESEKYLIPKRHMELIYQLSIQSKGRDLRCRRQGDDTGYLFNSIKSGHLTTTTITSTMTRYNQIVRDIPGTKMLSVIMIKRSAMFHSLSAFNDGRISNSDLRVINIEERSRATVSKLNRQYEVWTRVTKEA